MKTAFTAVKNVASGETHEKVPPDIRGTRIAALYAFIGENLSEERFFPEPLSKDF